jgi:predicted DNA-binding antitoxin AbrB/MazE fold protein
MTITVGATYEDGMLKPEGPLNLKEKSKVTVTIETPQETKTNDDPDGWKAMREFIGLAGEAVGSGNASLEHDAIIYRR